MKVVFKGQLPLPEEIKSQFPLSENAQKIVAERRRELELIFEGKDDRHILIIGPCSADNEDSVIDYIDRLIPLQEQVKEKLMIVPRVYTNKPRTTGGGYKGMLHQPDPHQRPDMSKGIIAVRKLHIRAIEEAGFVCADEMLYPDNYQYLDDVLGYVAIGARSVEDQQHRLTSSGIDTPVGMKNPTSGDYSVMMNAIYAAQHNHTFIYRGWEVASEGNQHAHAILRGYTDKYGAPLPNYHYEDIIRLCNAYDEMELKNPAVIIDCNHSNSGKNPFEQPRIIADILHSCKLNSRISTLVKGFMVESYIVEGNQDPDGGVYGKSITDACLGWEDSKKLILDVADML